MAGKIAKEAATEKVEMQMTPMIDVTFLLLIFFLCTIEFKLLDGKMAAYLPKDVGVNRTQLEIELEKIDINLDLSKSSALGFNLTVNGKKMSGLNQFYQTIKGLHDRAPDLKATIYPGKGIQYGHVIQTVNECLRASLTNITFGAVPFDE
jgi:biopolymer transport protein ExbD